MASLNETFSRLKTIDQKTKDCVNGYIRKIQALYSDDSRYQIIPELVTSWLLLYYFFGDAFDKYNCAEHYSLSKNDTILNQAAIGDGSAFLSKIVGAGVHEWKFRRRWINI